MAIDFSVEPEFQDKLHWMDEFVTQEIEPIDLYFRGEVNPFDRTNDTANALIRPLQQQVQDRGLWACHLAPTWAASATSPCSTPRSPPLTL